ncbi:hypothetical protein THYS13_07300 [Thermoanaerobacter sp. YS13]|uniref:hypothetical protein n=1 Tax=Thermoanaerobacter sp. YS13 TaxID=1511746 RepID=UPI0005759F54|nr:hypothetical protein [Thermoanaerobacter sp. YS13]KHO62667.1 hypothetical protein THYS13_07300 [Thermoanaerobacter sp. YS13]
MGGINVVEYLFGNNVVINSDGSVGLTGWQIIGDVSTTSISNRSFFKIGPQSSMKQDILLPRETKVIKISAEIAVDNMELLETGTALVNININYTDGDTDLLYVPLIVTKRDELLNQPGVYYIETVYKLQEKDYMSSAITIKRENSVGYIYISEIAVRPNLKVEQEASDSEIGGEVVFYKTFPIQSNSVTIEFTEPYAIQPTIFVNVYGDVTTFTPEFIIEWSEDKKAYLYTKVKLKFPDSYIGKTFSFMAIGR